ncbi:type IA DNA topoisomerase [Nostoc sp. UHCC 0702]|nr:type IA DNA topoisomerase [Nostoc sp. UHCC 0702]
MSAIANPRKLNLNLVGTGQCRDCLDKLVGYKGSPLVWALNNRAKSVGRVQSATLHLICKREREIQSFVPQDYWNVWVDYAEGFRAFYNGTSDQGKEKEQQEVETHDDAGTTAQTPESKWVLSESEATRLVEIARQNPHQVLTVEGLNPPLIDITSGFFFK